VQVIGQRTARHAVGDAVLVEHVALRDGGPAPRNSGRCLVGPRKRHDLLPPVDQPCGQCTADEAAGTRYEDLGHGYGADGRDSERRLRAAIRLSGVVTAPDASKNNRTRSMTSTRCSPSLGRMGGPKQTAIG
jgi:hypothetical protein